MNQGQNQQNYGSTSNSFEVTSKVNADMFDFFLSDRGFDPNNQTVNLEFPNGTILASGVYSVLEGNNGIGTLSYLPIQLNRIVTLYPGTVYNLVISGLPSGDNYNGNPGGGISQAYLTETANPCSGGYLGQCTWAPMQAGLMTLEPNGISNYNYMIAPIIEYSPGRTAGGEVALRFQATQAETLSSFSINIIKADSSYGGYLNVTLQSDNETCATGISGSCSHPSAATTNNPVLARSALSFSSINSTFATCPGY